MSMIYLDNNRTTTLAPEAAEAMRKFTEEVLASAPDDEVIRGAIEDARSATARALLVRTDEIVFTSGGTEANCLAILGAVMASSPRRRHVVMSRIEHESATFCAAALEAEGAEISFVPSSPDGTISPVAVQNAITPHTCLVSVQWANHETGVIQPIEEIARVAHTAGALCHSDAAQAVGRIPCDPRESVDLASLSAHKFHGPAGVGALWVREKVPLSPAFFGIGGEGRRRPGTRNALGIVGMAAAIRAAGDALFREMGRVRSLRVLMEQTLIDEVPGARINGNPDLRLPNTSSLRFEGTDGRALADRLAQQGIIAGGIPPATEDKVVASRSLLAMGLTLPEVRASIRFSLSRFNTEDEVRRAVEAVKEAVLSQKQA
ncbi:MAG TPA: cysteine desulfurase family protein [Candidatus Brocadiia bacterium]|nr:cysteine desulfurase family protein [Candidatus Brocadiia bacterium]